MHTNQVLRGSLSLFLTVALLLSLGTVPVSAEEAAEPAQTTSPAEPSSTPPTVPDASIPETTAPEITTPETTAATEPEVTQPEETPAATEATEPIPTAPENPRPTDPLPTDPLPTETEPAVTEAPALQPVDIALVKAMAPGTEDLLLEGTIVYAAHNMTVLQDATGGIRLTLPEGESAAIADAVTVTGTRSADGVAVNALTHRGRAELPCREATLQNTPEYVRVLIQNAAYVYGGLNQDTATVPITPFALVGIQPGESVRVWGVKAGNTFYVEKAEPYTPTVMDTLPAVTATPAEGILLPGENVGLFCQVEGTEIFYCTSRDGSAYGDYCLYSGGIPVESGQNTLYVRAFAQKAGWISSSETEFRFAREASAPESGQLHHYFGQLHAHTSYSDGLGTPAEAYAHARSQGLDFFAVTDHSDSFVSNVTATEDPARYWILGKQAADAATTGDFVAMYGYEMSWSDRIGHISTLGTAQWISSHQPGYDSLVPYYDAMTALPGSISQFNHPSAANGCFDSFACYRPQYDPYIQLLEVGRGSPEDNGYYYYTRALDQGWHVAPTHNQSRPGESWNAGSDVRTVILAPKLTREALYEAIRSRHVYATEDKNLKITYRLNGQLMGSVIREQPRVITAKLQDPDPGDTIQRVEVIADGGITLTSQQVDAVSADLTIPVSGGCHYYYLRITQADGNIAVTAPVWVDTEKDLSISAFTPDNPDPKQGDTVNLALTLCNNENTGFSITSVECFLNGVSVYKDETPASVAALSSHTVSIPLSYSGLGSVAVEAVVTGTLYGETVQMRKSLTLTYRPAETAIPLQSISQVRNGILGEVYRVQGSVTAGTSNPNTTFPGMLYLQDAAGGIAVSGCYAPDIPVGAVLEVVGYLEKQNQNPTLIYTGHTLLERNGQRIDPATISNSAAMDYAANGGKLVQVEGEVVSMTRTADNWGVSRFTLKDSQGSIATVSIDSAITSLGTGENKLITQVRAGRTVRARGLLHLEADGTPVIRVRNCEEVVYVAPRADPSNPKTQSGNREQIYLAGAVLAFSLSSLIVLYLIRKNGKR